MSVKGLIEKVQDCLRLTDVYRPAHEVATIVQELVSRMQLGADDNELRARCVEYFRHKNKTSSRAYQKILNTIRVEIEIHKQAEQDYEK